MENKPDISNTVYSDMNIRGILKEQKFVVPKMNKPFLKMGDVLLCNLIGGKTNLKLNSVKLMGSIIMQVMRDDKELDQTCIISEKELLELWEISASSVYQEVDKITDDIIKNPVYIRKEIIGKSIKWIKIPWMSKCEYDSDRGVAITLNKELTPFLISLKEHYTQNTLQEIFTM